MHESEQYGAKQGSPHVCIGRGRACHDPFKVMLRYHCSLPKCGSSSLACCARIMLPGPRTIAPWTRGNQLRGTCSPHTRHPDRSLLTLICTPHGDATVTHLGKPTISADSGDCWLVDNIGALSIAF